MTTYTTTLVVKGHTHARYAAVDLEAQGYRTEITMVERDRVEGKGAASAHYFVKGVK